MDLKNACAGNCRIYFPNNTLKALPEELRKPEADSEAKNKMIEKLSQEKRGHYIDSLKAKVFLQEKMLRSILKDDFTVSEKTEQSILPLLHCRQHQYLI